MKAFAAILAACAWAALGLLATASASNARSGDALGPASISTQTYCADLQQTISAERFRFSRWRCKQGPVMHGHETILGWVTMTRAGGEAHIELVWLVEMQPVAEAQVIDARDVPYYGYEPSYVRAAFRARTGVRLSA